MKALLFILSFTSALRFAQYEDACGACLDQSPQFRFSCTECIDTDKILNFCGKNVADKLQCPRGSKGFNPCKDAYISDALVGTFQSNYYSMSPGDTCMIRISIAMVSEFTDNGFWKIWEE